MRLSISARGILGFVCAVALYAAAAPPVPAAPRTLVNTVGAGVVTFIYSDSFRVYVDSTYARGFREIRLSGDWRLVCWQCTPDTIDIEWVDTPAAR